MKRCTKCLTSKQICDFYTRPSRTGGRLIGSYCKSCANAIRLAVGQAKAGVRRRKRERLKQEAIASPTKPCVACERVLPKERFYRQRDTLDGYKTTCKECHRDYSRIGRFLDRKTKARTEGTRPK